MTNRWTVRAKLTVLYGTLFLLAGTALLTITYFLLAQSLRNQGVDQTTVLTVPGLRPAVPARAASADDPEVTLPDGLTAAQQTEIEERWKLAEKLQEDFRSRTLTSLLQRGGIALAGVGLVGVWLSWLAARRTLRPLQQITATARRVADRNLHERIGLTGPHDELRRLADTFDDMLARLDGAFAAQRRFAANASHELRTPLAINRTLIEVALSRPHPSAEIRQLGETMLAVNARHEKLIDGLLLLARSDGAVLDPVPVDLADITTRVVAGVTEPGVELAVSTRPSPVRGDPVLLERMVQNLVQNAVAYNRRPGRVDVVCEPGTLTVTNTGPVIAAYEVPRLFEPFQRLTDRVGSARGTGLGLSIVRSVSRAHGGEVTAQPGPHGGLTVTVTVPPGPGAP
ncbi:sensor protein CutS [Actinoplanes sp. NBRC 14428]|uniref:histidine kinase n=1 Tax=Pseudosporangium ferrugineum TaxID=439699 RepID=A0A2T0SFM2_9ACTN|nr:ATP-binding protein [Pseudosporangium ferrugineum]PRY32215.1 signal transduction histidine kinase [Pseudosporangium ferrugineum]BCJ49540.1 sensor protein CutS [Actinoplanes sp. NBRC 14428]